jgi:hypothetical protein
MRRREVTNGVPRSATEATLRARTLPIVRHNAREERAAVRARDGIHSMGWRLLVQVGSPDFRFMQHNSMKRKHAGSVDGIAGKSGGPGG